MKESAILRDLGFTEGEIKVYYALFDLGETTVGPISQKSKVTHAKVYPILAKLIEKGLVSHIIKNGIKHFSATNPNSLMEFVDDRVRLLETEKEKIKLLIPALLAKQKNLEKDQYSRVYEGFKGLRSLFYELFAESNNEICVLGLNELLQLEGFVSFFRFYHDLRKKNNVRLKLILNKDMQKTIEKTYKSADMYSAKDKIKFVDKVYPTGVFIFKDHVINVVADEVITAFDVKSRQNAERYKAFFDSIWNKK
jgi:HTH-type transcriptional regulator, sugar sensing transcriptional regulator